MAAGPGWLPPAACAIAFVVSHLPRPRPDQGTWPIRPALNIFSDSSLLVSRVKLRVRWPFLVIALFRAVLRRHPAGPAVSVTTAVCRLAPRGTPDSATRPPGRWRLRGGGREAGEVP